MKTPWLLMMVLAAGAPCLRAGELPTLFIAGDSTAAK
jgi:hypothetical protein